VSPKKKKTCLQEKCLLIGKRDFLKTALLQAHITNARRLGKKLMVRIRQM
jgi:hypothetical protein